MGLNQYRVREYASRSLPPRSQQTSPHEPGHLCWVTKRSSKPLGVINSKYPMHGSPGGGTQIQQDWAGGANPIYHITYHYVVSLSPPWCKISDSHALPIIRADASEIIIIIIHVLLKSKFLCFQEAFTYATSKKLTVQIDCDYLQHYFDTNKDKYKNLKIVV